MSQIDLHMKNVALAGKLLSCYFLGWAWTFATLLHDSTNLHYLHPA